MKGETKKARKPLPPQFTLTIQQRDLDMLESAITQLAEREPGWTASVRRFATHCQLDRTIKVLDSIKQTKANRQMEMTL